MSRQRERKGERRLLPDPSTDPVGEPASLEQHRLRVQHAGDLVQRTQQALLRMRMHTLQDDAPITATMRPRKSASSTSGKPSQLYRRQAAKGSGGGRAAAGHGNAAVARMLTARERQFLHACAGDNLTLVQRALEHGTRVSPNIFDKYRRNGLMYAAINGQVDTLNTLLALPEVDMNAADAGGDTAVHHSVCGGSVLILRALLKAGAAPNISDRLGRTPLHVAGASRTSSEACRWWNRGSPRRVYCLLNMCAACRQLSCPPYVF